MFRHLDCTTQAHSNTCSNMQILLQRWFPLMECLWSPSPPLEIGPLVMFFTALNAAVNCCASITWIPTDHLCATHLFACVQEEIHTSGECCSSLGFRLRFVGHSYLHNLHTSVHPHTEKMPKDIKLNQSQEAWWSALVHEIEWFLAPGASWEKPEELLELPQCCAKVVLQWVSDALNLPTAGRTLSFLTLILRNVKEFVNTHT